jgi:SAM-dependent methyltransferase
MSPLRDRVAEVEHGCFVLSRVDLDYRDGGERRVLEIVEGAADLTSLSDELERQASTWPERYHLVKSRGNVVRPLALARTDRVLELGAGCGAVTRVLGERCSLVDAVEPMPERARIARARTRELDGVEVFVGTLDDVPPEASYDLVTLVGVLEYVADGRPEHAAYAGYLREVGRRLRPGGTVLIAIENRIGVKYLAGAPEDHTNRLFDGLEDYPRGGHARCFTHLELESIVEQAGLVPRFLYAFPDYKLPRVVFADGLLHDDAGRRLACDLPRFPSPSWMGPGARAADERRLWHTLVKDGLGAQFANSFIVLATAGDESPLWPQELAACFYNTHRRSSFATQTRVVRRADGSIGLEQSLVGGEERRVEDGALALDLRSWSFVPGETLLDVLASCAPDDVPPLLLRWRQVLRSVFNDPTARAPLDLVPHNLVVTRGDRLVPIDLEWSSAGYSEDDVVARGVLWLAAMVSEITVPERWPGATVRELAVRFGRQAGLEPGGAWIDPALRREAEFQARIYDADPDDPGWDEALQRQLAGLESNMARRLDHMPLGLRDHDRLLSAEARVEDAERRLTHAAGVLAGYEADIGHLRSDLDKCSEELSSAMTREQTAAARVAATETALAQAEAALDDQRRRVAEMEDRWRRLESRLPVRLYREAQAIRRRRHRG